MAENIGRVISISGPAVDVQFEEKTMPPIYQALRIVSDGFVVPKPMSVIVEVQQHLGEGRVRTVAMQATDGMVNMATPMTLAMSPGSEVNLTKVTQYNVSVMDMIKKNFPKLKVVTALEYATTSGNLVQLIARDLETQEVAFCAFNEKMRAHAVVRDTSSFKQKKSGGTWGTILEQPTDRRATARHAV